VTRLCDELLQGAIDLHQHAAPSVFERVTDDIGLALESRQRGMRAVLLKAHEHDTTGRAALVRRQVPGIETFGGIVLNHSVGGLNPQAVDGCIKLGGRMVWMPTLSARHHIGFFGGSHFGASMRAKVDAADRETTKQKTLAGLSVLDAHGALLPRGPRNPRADRRGRHLFLDRPPLASRDPRPREGSAQHRCAEEALAADGAILEKDIITMMPAWQSLSLQQMVASIRAIGPAHCALATDFGQLHHPVPPEGMRMFVQLLLEQGITPDDIRTMVAENPARLLGVDERV